MIGRGLLAGEAEPSRVWLRINAGMLVRLRESAARLKVHR
jgi:hypothetical protein